MSSFLLENVRSNMEVIEQTEKGIVLCLFNKLENPKESVVADHKIRVLIDIIQNKSMDALINFNDNDGSKKEELMILAGQKPYSSQNKQLDVWQNFYDRLKDIREYHKKFAPQFAAHTKNTPNYIYENCFKPPFKEPYFSGEECNGKYVDMHHLYLEFTNLKKIKLSEDYKIGDYLWYLQNFDQFHEIPASLKEKEHKKFKRYLRNLLEYLKDFFKRVQPLTDFNVVDLQINEDFNYRWKEGTIRGWEKKEETKEDIHNNPLYCNACAKLFSNENTYINHFPGKKHKNNEKIYTKQQIKNPEKNEENRVKIQRFEEIDRKELASLESYIVRLKELLGDIVHDTMNQIRKKQTRTYEEMEAENYNFQEIEVEKSESEDEGPIYNPKNLPLGWDGKPIPYWLYKLHGLGIEYKCEICGNYSYWGRRAFERHFQEWRHAYGMKCLRIPNTIHFKEITSINDALALHQKLLLEADASHFKPDVEEEYEDNEGNVLNKKMYLDLKRQGLLDI